MYDAFCFMIQIKQKPMKILYTGDPTSKYHKHIVKAFEELVQLSILNASNASNKIEIFFVDGRLNAQTNLIHSMNDHDNSVHYNFINPSIDSIIETLYDDEDNITKIAYINLDCLSSNITHYEIDVMLKEIMTNCKNSHYICLSTGRILNAELISNFNRICMLHDTSPPSIEGVTSYWEDEQSQLSLKNFISKLDPDSDLELNLNHDLLDLDHEPSSFSVMSIDLPDT